MTQGPPHSRPSAVHDTYLVRLLHSFSGSGRFVDAASIALDVTRGRALEAQHGVRSWRDVTLDGPASSAGTAPGEGPAS